MDLIEIEPFKKRRISQQDAREDEEFLREYSEDGFRIINTDACNYVSGNRNLDFINLVNLIEVDKN
jgi:hypothetical protein